MNLSTWRIRTLAALALLLSTVTASAAQPTPGITLSRDAAVAMAIRNNVDLRSEALNTAMAETDLARSKAFYDPFLSMSANGGITNYAGEDYQTRSKSASLGLTQYLPTGGSIAVGTSASQSIFAADTAGTSDDVRSSVGLTLSHPLLKRFGWETTNLGISLAESSRQDSVERFGFFLADTVYAVITSYNRLYVLRQTLTERQSALASTQALLQELNAAPATGPLRKVEIANAEYALSQRRRDLVETERSVRDREAELRYLIGLDEPGEIVPSDPPSREEPQETGAQALQIALASRADLKQLRTALRNSELQERVARRQTLPDLTLTASGGLSGDETNLGDSFRELGDGEGLWWSAGLQLSMPIGNSAARNDHRRSTLRSEQLQNQLAAFAWQIRNAVEADMRALISARLQMQTSDKSLQFAEERLTEYRRHRREGRGTVQDLLNAENDLTAARNAQLGAVEYFAQTVALLWRDMGVLLERQQVGVDISQPQLVTRQTPPPEAKIAALKSGSTTGAGRPEAYTLKLDDALAGTPDAALRSRLARHGLTPRLQDGPPRSQAVIRLCVGTFPDQAAAKTALEQLRAAYVEGVLSRNAQGRYEVYAGSYFSSGGANNEQKRLAAFGVSVTQRLEEVPVPTKQLLAGDFATRAAATAAAGDLRRQGLAAEVVIR